MGLQWQMKHCCENLSMNLNARIFTKLSLSLVKQLQCLWGNRVQAALHEGGWPLYLPKRKSAAEYLQDSGAGLDTVEKWKPASAGGGREGGKQCMYNVTLRHIHCYNRKPIHMTYFGCVFVDLGIQHAMCTHHIAMYGLPGSTIFCHLIS